MALKNKYVDTPYLQQLEYYDHDFMPHPDFDEHNAWSASTNKGASLQLHNFTHRRTHTKATVTKPRFCEEGKHLTKGHIIQSVWGVKNIADVWLKKKNISTRRHDKSSTVIK